MDDTETPSADAADTRTEISVSPGMADWLVTHGLSLAFTTYQTGQLFLVGVTPEGKVSFNQQNFRRAMGLAWQPGRLWLGGLFQLWRLENMLAPGQIGNGRFDRVFVPRSAQTIGEVDIHEVGVMDGGHPVFVNTKYSCLARLDPVHSFRPIWRPPFVSALAAEDRCHLNGLAIADGTPRYATAAAQTDTEGGWRARREDGGVLIDVETGRIVSEGLSMPHSPCAHEGQVYLLDSGRGLLVRVDPESGARTEIAACPGFLRGLAIHESHAIVTISKPRDGHFSGLPLDDALAEQGTEPWCGVLIVDLASGETVEWIRLDGHIVELFDVAAMPGVRCPMAIGPDTAEIRKTHSFDPTLPSRPES